MDLSFALFLLPGLIIGLTVHEASHAVSAMWLGDRTAEKMGRVSLNPLRHLSPMGTLALFFLGFGWGKPVIVNLYNFKKPKFYYLLSSLAGPASNLILSAIALGMLYVHKFVTTTWLTDPAWAMAWFLDICKFLYESVFLINAIMAVFNLLPIPPLDGSKIWPCVIPGMKPITSGKLNMIWMGVLLVALYSGMISKVVGPVIGTAASLMPSDRIENEVRPEDFPEALVLPEGAYEVRYFKSSDGGEESYDLRFCVEQAYPAKELFTFFNAELTALGWAKQQYNPSDPNQPAQTEWEVLEGEHSTYHHWGEHWLGPLDQTLSMTLSTRFSERSPDSVLVWMSIYSEEFGAESPIAEDQ